MLWLSWPGHHVQYYNSPLWSISRIIYLYQHLSVFWYFVDGASPVTQRSKSPHRNVKWVATDTRAGRHREPHEAAFGFNLESSNPLCNYWQRVASYFSIYCRRHVSCRLLVLSNVLLKKSILKLEAIGFEAVAYNYFSTVSRSCETIMGTSINGTSGCHLNNVP